MELSFAPCKLFTKRWVFQPSPRRIVFVKNSEMNNVSASNLASGSVINLVFLFFVYITEIKNWLPYRGLTDSSGAQELGSSQPGDIQPTHPMGSSETNASVARPAQVLKPGSIPHHLPTYFSFPPIQVWWIWKRKTKLLKLYSNKICSKENTEEEVLKYRQDSWL